MSVTPQLDEREILAFRAEVYGFYREHRRAFLWRETREPYRIYVSEIMLQQTQTARVVRKYLGFIIKFPDFGSLATAGLGPLYEAWSGLGYNRRALMMREAAKKIVSEHGGSLPRGYDELLALPGVGPATAGALTAFAFGKPAVFIETNIRRVFIRHFFPDSPERVCDRELFPLIEATLDREDPRNWYYALMDYGSELGRSGENPNRKSRHYVRQKPFRDSDREIRGMILKVLSERGELSREDLAYAVGADSARFESCISDLVEEGFLVCDVTVRFRT